MSSISSTRVELLQAFLRWRRAHLSRKDVGLPARAGSRGGLTQEDLAELTGYSTNVVVKLENGRLRSPSAELLEAVAGGLRLTADERKTFWLLAARTTPPSGMYSAGPDAGLTRLIDHLYPHPAYVTDALWNVHAYNRAVAEWFTDFSQVPDHDRNIAKWIYLDPHAQHVFVRWEADFARVFLARMRAVMAMFPDDPRIANLVAELRERSPYVGKSWLMEPDIYIDPPTETRIFRRPGHTDPERTDDSDHHIDIDMVILGPLRPNDERRIVVFLLPPGEPHRPNVLSAQACTACRRQ